MSLGQSRTYDLHISFIGLCLSAPTKKGSSLEVVMPEAKDHSVAIVFDGRFAGAIHTPFVAEPADDCHIDLTTLKATDGFRPYVPPEILDVYSLLPNAKLCDRCKSDGSLADQVNSLVTLSRGCAVGIGLPKTWLVGKDAVRMRLTHCLEWCIQGVEGNTLELSKLGAPANVPPLTSIDSLSGPEIRLQIVCLPPAMICQFPAAPAQLPAGYSAPHFAMFGCLFDGWDAQIVPKSTGPEGSVLPGHHTPMTVSAQDCISAGWGGG